MVSIYYLSGFNNYYNRTILLPQSTKVVDYQEYNIIKTDTLENFNPNDNVMTQLITNYWEGTADEDGIDDITTIDYILVSRDGINIDSRWFVLDRQRVRGQQWQMTLRRDLVADNYEDVITAPCFIEKATLPADSPFLWNKEEMTFNQIKQSEHLLKDASNCAWIVGYLAENAGAITGMNKIEPIGPTLESKSDYPLAQYMDKEVCQPIYIKSRVFVEAPDFSSTGYNYEYVINETERTIKRNNSVSETGGYQQAPNKDQTRINNTIMATWPAETPQTIYQSYFTTIDFMTKEDEKLMSAELGKIYKIGEKFYRVRSRQAQATIFTETAKIPSGMLFNRLKNAFSNADHNYSFLTAYNPNSDTFSMSIDYRKVEYYWEELEGDVEVKATISDDRYHPYDAPYDIFAIPYTDDMVITASGNISCSKDVSLSAAMGLVRDNPGKIYDIQLLPYCPVPYAINASGEIDLTEVGKYDEIVIPPPAGTTTVPATKVGVILYATESKISFNIPYVIDVPTDATGRKVMNECEMYRICSPNYNGVFEFSPAKNGGVKEFNVDISFIPYSPYIHINPDFGGMYGSDFDDSRGLVCGGDFSLPITSDEWESYKIQNKNYMEIFNREIQSMDVQNNIQRQLDIVNAITSGITATGAGAMTGASIGKFGGAMGAGIGAGIGAGVGAVAGIIGGIADVNLNQKLRDEARDYKIDQFGYQLANIQALPYSLARTTAYTNNNKIFPFVEKYSSKEEEKQALRAKIEYDGMTVMVIGKIEDYQQENPTYIKGRLIRLLNNPTLDYHSLTELANEIYKGVFI